MNFFKIDLYFDFQCKLDLWFFIDFLNDFFTDCVTGMGYSILYTLFLQA